MKKAVSVFLLGIFLFNIAGVFCLYSVLKHLNYRDIFSRSAAELNLVELTIRKTELNWRNAHEIIHNGKCYDVLSKSEDDKNYFLLCHADNEEDILNAALNNHVSAHLLQGTTQKNSSHHFSIKVFIQDFILRSSSLRIQFVVGETNLPQNPFSLSQGFLSIFSPPPDTRLT